MRVIIHHKVMVNNVFEIAEKFEAFAARRPKGNTMSSKQMRKKWQKQKDEYHSCKKELTALETEQESLDKKVDDMRQRLFDARKGMLDMSRALDKLDLAGATHSVFYDSGDVSFVVDKEEYHLEMRDEGEFDLVSMKEFLKNKKKDQALADDKKEEEPPIIEM